MEKILNKTFKIYEMLKDVKEFRDTFSELNSTQIMGLESKSLHYLLEGCDGKIIFWADLFLKYLKENIKKALQEQEQERKIKNQILTSNIFRAVDRWEKLGYEFSTLMKLITTSFLKM
jgi:hypothetical protein